MKSIFNILIFLGVAVVCGQPNFEAVTITQLQKSSLRVSGTTNVTGFTCLFESEYLENETLIAYRNQDGRILLRNAKLELDIDGFDCGGRGINKDFRAMLKADQYPVISLDFKELNQIGEHYEAVVGIVIAGQKHAYTIPVTITQADLKHLKGILKLNISDYDLELPKKMFGLIKIRDVIAIEFDIAGSIEEVVLE